MAGWGASTASATTLLITSAVSPGNVVESNGATTSNFIVPGAGGLSVAADLKFGPGGDLYVLGNNGIYRYNGTTGALIGTGAFTNGTPALTPLNNPQAFAFQANGDLIISSYGNDDIYRYSGSTGTYTDMPVTGAAGPTGMEFHGGNLFVANLNDNTVKKYTPSISGPYTGGGNFVSNTPPPTLDNPHHLTFGPDGNLYVTSFSNGSVQEYNGATGAFIKNFITPGEGGLVNPTGLLFADGSLFVSDYTGGKVLQYDGTLGTFTKTFATVASPIGLIEIPEPCTLSLLTLAAGLGLRRRR